MLVCPVSSTCRGSTPRIAVLEISGAIGVQVKAPEMVRTIKALREDRRVQAVVVEIGSPGSSAPVSDAIFRALRRLTAKSRWSLSREAARFRRYLIACGAHKIVALPGACGIDRRHLREARGAGVAAEGGRAHGCASLRGGWAMFQPWREPTREETKVKELTDEYCPGSSRPSPRHGTWT